MNVQFRLPPLTAGSEKEQLRQLYGYLRQTVEQLNWAMGQLSAPAPTQQATQAQRAAGQTPDAQALSSFQTLKALIIKSQDIAQASYEKTRELLRQNGDFVAESQFGTYREELEQSISAHMQGIDQRFSRVDAITGSIGDSLRTQKSYLRFGLVGTTLDAAAATTAPGIELGDFLTLEQGGNVALQQRFARFTTYGLELFGSDSQRPVAYISDRELHIEIARIRQLMLGNFVTTVGVGGSLVKRWVTDQVQEEA